MDERLRAALHLEAILPLMVELAAHDPVSAEAAGGKRRVVQFEVKNGPTAHLVIGEGAVRYGRGAYFDPDIRLVYKNEKALNRAFTQKKGRPKIRKGYRHLWFLWRKFPVLDRRLTYFLEGEGRTDPEAKQLVVRLGLRAMLGGMACVAAKDPSLRRVAEQTPAGTLLVGVLPDGPFGTFEKAIHNGASEFRSSFGRPVAAPSAQMIISSPDAARDLIAGKLNVATAIGLGKDIRIRGLLPLIEKAGIFLYRFGRITRKEGA